MQKLKIAKGDKYHYFTVIHEMKKINQDGNRFALCKCECGEERIVLIHSLINGNHKSCGCRGTEWKQYKYTKEEYDERKRKLSLLRSIKNNLPH